MTPHGRTRLWRTRLFQSHPTDLPSRGPSPALKRRQHFHLQMNEMRLSVTFGPVDCQKADIIAGPDGGVGVEVTEK